MTRHTEGSEPMIVVDAPHEEIDDLLREELSAEDYARIKVDLIPDPQEAHLGRRRAELDLAALDVLISAIQFVAGAVASGYTHDLCKKTVRILVKRWGEERVFTPPSSETPSSERLDLPLRPAEEPSEDPERDTS